jgi:hypothetical protein
MVVHQFAQRKTCNQGPVAHKGFAGRWDFEAKRVLETGLSLGFERVADLKFALLDHSAKDIEKCLCPPGPICVPKIGLFGGGFRPTYDKAGIIAHHCQG